MQKETSGGSGLQTHVASTLAYVGWWVSGLIVLLLKTDNRVVRFHAMQSIVVFGAASILIVVLSMIASIFSLTVWQGALVPVSLVFTILWALVLAFSIVLWILLMVKTYQKEQILVPLAGDVAFWLLGKFNMQAPEREAMAFHGLTGGEVHKRETGRYRPRHEDSAVGRAFGSVAVIVWCTFLFIVFNFFPDYIAFYHSTTQEGVSQLLRYPILTAELGRVLPLLNLTLGLAVLGHVFALVWNRFLFRELLEVVLHILGLAVAVLFLWVFPFDYSDLPVAGLRTAMPTVTIIILILAIVGNVIEVIVHTVRFLRGLVAR